MKKKIDEVSGIEAEDIQESKPDSPAKIAFRAHIAAYAKQNPKKYELKEEALLKKLESL